MQSTHWGADDSVDELLYDSKSVDDWGVNRDMSGAYRQVSLLFPQGMPDSLHYSKHGDHAFSQGRNADVRKKGPGRCDCGFSHGACVQAAAGQGV